jgi:hypothetical protein
VAGRYRRDETGKGGRESRESRELRGTLALERRRGLLCAGWATKQAELKCLLAAEGKRRRRLQIVTGP